MLNRINRITENREFLRIFKTVRPYHTEHMAFRVAKRQPPREITNDNYKGIAAPSTKGMARNDREGRVLPARFGFVISNKIDKRSARRNGMKRRIRAVIEKNLPEISNGIDLVIQVKKPFDFPYNFSVIEKEVIEGLRRSGVVR